MNRTCLGLFQFQMRTSFPFLLAKDLRRFLLIMRTCSFLTLLYIGGTYARLLYTWYTNIFHMIAVLIIFLSVGEKNVMKTISKRDIDDTDKRQCYC